MLYCGWDGGGTKTEVCLQDETGRTVASAVFGPLNPNGAQASLVRETVRRGISYMKEQFGGEKEIGSLVIGVAGITNRGVRPLMEEALAEAGWHGPVQLAGDQEIALAGAVDGPGMMLIAGTGSVCYGRDRDGNRFQIGGLGYLIGDEGSGWAIGRDILAEVGRAADGRSPATVLTSMVYEKMGFSATGDLVTWLYAPETGKKEVASLASLLPEALDRGDPAAKAIACRAAADLAEIAETGWKRSGLSEGFIVFTGSILSHMPFIREKVEAELHQKCPGLTIVPPRGTPAEGAAKMAREIAEAQRRNGLC